MSAIVSEDVMRKLVERIKSEVVHDLHQQHLSGSATSSSVTQSPSAFGSEPTSPSSTFANASSPASSTTSRSTSPDDRAPFPPKRPQPTHPIASAPTSLTGVPVGRTIPSTLPAVTRIPAMASMPASRPPAAPCTQPFLKPNSGHRSPLSPSGLPQGPSTSPNTYNSQPPQPPQPTGLALAPLFDAEGDPTDRMHQFLRGLAGYLISEYQSPNTVAILPATLDNLFADFEIEPEVFPLQDLFSHRSKSGLERIEGLYVELRCEYVLVQAEPRFRADIPALTPVGFDSFIRRLIAASPDHEARRLSLIISQLPVNPDGSRLADQQPKVFVSLPRNLFPAVPDESTRRRVFMAFFPRDEFPTAPAPATKAASIPAPFPIPRQNPNGDKLAAGPGTTGKLPAASSPYPTQPVPSSRQRPPLRLDIRQAPIPPTSHSRPRSDSADSGSYTTSSSGDDSTYVLSTRGAPRDSRFAFLDSRYPARDPARASSRPYGPSNGGGGSDAVYATATPRAMDRQQERVEALTGRDRGRDQDSDRERDRRPVRGPDLDRDRYREQDRDRYQARDQDRDRNKERERVRASRYFQPPTALIGRQDEPGPTYEEAYRSFRP